MGKRSVQGMSKNQNVPDIPDRDIDALIAKAKQQQAEETRNSRPPTSENAIPDDEVNIMIARAKARKEAEKRNPPPKRRQPPPSNDPAPPKIRQQPPPKSANHGGPSNQQGNSSMTKRYVGGQAKPVDDISDEEVAAMIARAKAREAAEKCNSPRPEMDNETAQLIVRAKARALEDAQRSVDEERAKKNAIKAEKKRKADESAKKREDAHERKFRDAEGPSPREGGGNSQASKFNKLFGRFMEGSKKDDKSAGSAPPPPKKSSGPKSPKRPDNSSKEPNDRAYIPRRPADLAGDDIEEDDIAAMIANVKPGDLQRLKTRMVRNDNHRNQAALLPGPALPGHLPGQHLPGQAAALALSQHFHTTTKRMRLIQTQRIKPVLSNFVQPGSRRVKVLNPNPRWRRSQRKRRIHQHDARPHLVPMIDPAVVVGVDGKRVNGLGTRQSQHAWLTTQILPLATKVLGALALPRVFSFLQTDF
jgi:hypothetical protein